MAAKYNISFFILLCITVLAGCQSGKTGTTYPGVRTGDISYTNFTRSFSTGVKTGGRELDTTGGYWCMVDLTVVNNGKHTLLLDSTYFSLTDPEGTIFPFSQSGAAFYSYFETNLYGKEVLPGNEEAGFIIFAVPSIQTYLLHLKGDPWNRETTTVTMAVK